MTFEEILDQAIAMLQRRGRLTYGTLKRQFQLDDVALADLPNELIKGQRLARDEDDEVLVWTGAAGEWHDDPDRPPGVIVICGEGVRHGKGVSRSDRVRYEERQMRAA